MVTQSRKDEYERLVRHLGHWSWMFLLYKYDSTHVLIADRWFLDKVNAARAVELKCLMAEPSTYADVINDKVKRVLVLCGDGELALVRKLQAEYPKKIITSGTYDYACVGRDRYPRMVEFRGATQNQAVASSKDEAPVFVLSTPYADAEFIMNVMAENGLPNAHEYLGRPFATWLNLHKNFQINRFYHMAQQRFAKDGALHCLVQTDVLNSLFANTAYSLQRFIEDLQKMNAKVVLVTRRDTIAQATIGYLLDRTAERSVWTKKPSKKLAVKFLAGDFIGCYKQYDQVLQAEKILEKIENSPLSTIRLCLEDFILDQPAEIKGIATFLEHELEAGKDIVQINYNDGYKTAPTLLPLSQRFNREMVDRLGLHMSSAV